VYSRGGQRATGSAAHFAATRFSIGRQAHRRPERERDL